MSTIQELQEMYEEACIRLQRMNCDENTTYATDLETQIRILKVAVNIRKELDIQVEKENYERASSLKRELNAWLKSLNTSIVTTPTSTSQPTPPKTLPGINSAKNSMSSAKNSMSHTQKVMHRSITKINVMHYRKETDTHHGYHPDEWKKCYNRVQNRTFWVHLERGTISHYDPASLHPDHDDPVMREIFNEIFQKVVNDPVPPRKENNHINTTNVTHPEIKHQNGFCKSILVCCGTCCCNACFIACCPCLCCVECITDPHGNQERWVLDKCLSFFSCLSVFTYFTPIHPYQEDGY